MADLTVKRDTPLDDFLRENRTQLWRIPILVANGGVKVFRNKREIVLKDGQAPLKSGDKVRLVSPIPAACSKALQNEANAHWRDYAVIPGTTPFDQRLAKFLAARTNTIVIQDPQLFVLQDFLSGIATSKEITNPIRHLLVVGHGSIMGRFKFALYQLPVAFVEYEDLEAAVKDPKKRLVVDLSLLMPRPVEKSGTSVAQLRLFGCHIGGEVAYMKKLKEALGNQIMVLAPKHALIGATLQKPPGELAYMGYPYSVFLPKAVKNKAELVDEFAKRKDFVRVDKKQVPRKFWKVWLPDRPNKTPNPKDWGVTPNAVTLPVFGGTSYASRLFAYGKDRPLFSGMSQLRLAKDTGKEVDRKNAVKTALQKLDRYKDTHPFPEYVRWGYKTMDEFIDGWTWTFDYDKKTQILSYNGKRDEYRMLQPAANVTTNALIMNYYPTKAVPKKFQKLVPIEQLLPNDTFFFGAY